ncbi:MAG: amidohydrolase family protein [Pyramidobacter sp.]|jgi:cytosine/adenosine deaminase-related metal-dependent hydrolase
MGEITGLLQNGEKALPTVIRWNDRGIITAVERSSATARNAPTLRAGKFNAHSHPEQSIYTDLVDKSWDLGTWCRNTIYKYSTAMTPRRVRLACRRAFSRMLLNGTTAVMVSYYLHGRSGNNLDREVIAAARDVGVRLIFGRMNYDMVDKSAYEAKQLSQKFYFETPDEAEANLRRLMDEEDDGVMVCPALHSFHASTPEAMIRAITLGAELDRPVQLHLSEDRGDVELSMKQHGCRPVEYLDALRRDGKIPSLSGVILSDCCWLDDNERRLIAENAMRVVINPRMNDRVKTGFPDVAALLDAKIELWCGTDGEASNDSLDVDDERTFLKKRLAGTVPPSAIDGIGRQSFDFGGHAMGPLEPGAWADFSVVEDGKLVDLYVGGRPVVSGGALTKLDVERDIELPLKAEIAAMTSK